MMFLIKKKSIVLILISLSYVGLASHSEIDIIKCCSTTKNDTIEPKDNTIPFVTSIPRNLTTGQAVPSMDTIKTRGTNSNTPTGRTSNHDGRETGSIRTVSNNVNEEKVNSSAGTGVYDGTGDGVFGRKVTYRDISAAYKAVNQSGKVAVKICVNQAGQVTFAEIILDETTINDKTTLSNYLKAARNYKVQPDKTAPKEQCGKLMFKVDKEVNGKLRKN